METRYRQTKSEAMPVVWVSEHFDKFINVAPQFRHQRPQTTGDNMENTKTIISDQALGISCPEIQDCRTGREEYNRRDSDPRSGQGVQSV